MALKRIRILTGKPGFPAGTVTEMEESDAARWLGTGDGEETKDRVTRQAGKAETATADPTK